MSHAAVAAAYDELAERWLDDRFPADNGISHHRRAFSFLSDLSDLSDISNRGGGYALNVGCGCNTRLTRLLASHGLAVEGVDISRRMVELARAADPHTPVHHADICDWAMPRRYVFISAWDSIWHVDLRQQRPLLLKLLRALEPGGILLFTAGGLDGPAEHHDSCMGPRLYYASLGIPAMLDTLNEGNALCRHLEFDQLPESHLVVIAQRAS